MFLHCFFQLHVSAPAMSHLQVDHFFVCKTNHAISVANCMVCLAKKKVINLKMAHSQNRNV